MFKSLRNIETAFQQIRLIVLIFIVCLTGISGFAIYKSYEFSQEARQKIYVLDAGKSLILALRTDVKDNRPVEAKDHVKRFHQLFFTIDPDDKAIQTNINEALFLADESAKTEYENLKEKGFYNQIISASISMEIVVDSVSIDFSQYPYYAKCFANQQIIRATNVTKRSMVSECYLRNISRSDNKPHGFLMMKWRVLQNKDISTEVR